MNETPKYQSSAEKDTTGFLMVAHQMQSPLSAAKWTLSMLINGDAGNLTLEQKELAEKAYESVDRSIRLLRDVLSANRLEAGKEVLALESVPMLEIINDSVNELSEVAREKGVKLQVVPFESWSPFVEVDKEKMRDAFENLIDNAIKYTPKGGIVKVVIKEDGDDALITVEDNGIGIDEEDEDKIFGRFYRGVRAKQAKTTGTGLGLYISKSIIEKHGGKIWFEDKKRDLHMEESGVKFSFTIPLQRGV